MSRKRIAVICARGGSKGIPGKNIRPLAGRPLIVHSLEQAEQSGQFDAIAVSSDSQEILDVAKEYGCIHLIRRPEELANDSAPKVPAIRHCVEQVEAKLSTRFDTVVDLAVTSPLRHVADIQDAVSMFEAGSAPNMVSGNKAASSPYFNIVELDADRHVRLSKTLERPFLRRQDAPAVYELNGAIYLWRRDVLDQAGNVVLLPETVLFEMPPQRAVDIDTPLDFSFVEFLLEQECRG